MFPEIEIASVASEIKCQVQPKMASANFSTGRLTHPPATSLLDLDHATSSGTTNESYFGITDSTSSGIADFLCF